MSKNNNLSYEAEEMQDVEEELLEEEELVEEQPKTGGYCTLSIVAFLLAIGGLFLGLVEAFKPILYTSGRLSGSLLSVLWGATKKLLKMPYTYTYDRFTYGGVSTASAMQKLVNLMPYVIAVGLAIAFICLVISLCAGTGKKRSLGATKSCAFVAIYAVFASYALYMVALFAVQMIGGAQLAELRSYLDLPSAIVTLASLITIVIAHLANKKNPAKYVFINLLMLLLSLGTAFALLFPASFTVGAINTIHKFNGETGLVLVEHIMLLVVVALVAINTIYSALHMGAKKGMAVSVVLTAIELVAAILLVLFHVLNNGNDFGVLIKLPTLVLLLTVLSAFLLSLFTCVAIKAAEKAALEEEAEDEDEEELLEEAEAQTEEAASEPAAEPAPAEQPAPVAPVPTPAPYMTAPVVNYIMPAPGYMPPMYGAPIAPIAPVASAPVAPVPAPAPASAEMSEFERSMAALAKGEAPAPAPAPAPVAMPTPVTYKPAPAPVVAPVENSGNYDSFIGTLTESEKNEFVDLFILGRNGANGALPLYAIGGDNKEFFAKVFIYLGRFRAQASTGLLTKLYNHVTKL